MNHNRQLFEKCWNYIRMCLGGGDWVGQLLWAKEIGELWLKGPWFKPQ